MAKRRQRKKQRHSRRQPNHVSLDPSKPGFQLKLDRANDHIDALDKSIQEWLDSGAYTLVYKNDPKTGYEILQAKIKKPIDPTWPLLIGDAVHNLRSTLDHIAFALMEAYQAAISPGVPIDDSLIRSSEFPIIGDVNENTGKVGDGAHDFDSVAGRTLKGIHPDARAAIKKLQPYQSGSGFRTHELWLIHDLDRLDKHRELRVVAAAAKIRKATIGGTGFLSHFWLLGDGPVEDGTKIAEWSKGATPNMHLSFRRDVAFGEGEPIQYASVIPTLRLLSEYVRTKVLPALEPYL